MDFRYWFTFFWFCILDQLNFLRRKMLMQRNSIKIYRWTTINDPSWLSNVPLSRLIEHEMLTCSLLNQSNWESMNSGAAHPTKADKGTWSNKDTLDNHVAISAFLRDSGENGRIDIQLGICRVSALNTMRFVSPVSQLNTLPTYWSPEICPRDWSLVKTEEYLDLSVSRPNFCFFLNSRRLVFFIQRYSERSQERKISQKGNFHWCLLNPTRGKTLWNTPKICVTTIIPKTLKKQK